VDYSDPSIRLYGWDALVLDEFPLKELLVGLAARENLVLENHRDFARAVENIRRHRSCFALLNREQLIYELSMDGHEGDLDRLIRILKDFEQELDRKNLRIIYIADDQSRTTLNQHEKAHCLILRPFFTKEEVLERTIEGKMLPRKSTRHLFPLRPLRIDIDFILLKESIDLETKNKLLQAHLNWWLENNMVRHYPESVLVFSDQCCANKEG